MIPKLIHQIWIGNTQIPEIWRPHTKSWQRKNPEYQYILWDNSRIKRIDSDDYLSLNVHPAFLCDVFRYKLLSLFGGFYFDVDFDCMKPIDTWGYDFKNIDFFTIDYCGTTQNGLMASGKNSPISKRLYDEIPRHSVSQGNVYGPWWLDRVLKNFEYPENINIFMERKNVIRFLPEWYGASKTVNSTICTGNDVRHSTWYPSKLCPHENIINSQR